MSPLKKEKLSKIRKELDKLDDSLIKIIKKRTNLVKRVLALKEKKNQIVDQNPTAPNKNTKLYTRPPSKKTSKTHQIYCRILPLASGSNF